MGYYGSILDVPAGDIRYTNNCVDGQCSGCGECCTDLLPLTREEVRRLQVYAWKHRLKEHSQAPFFDPGATDLTCPFRNQAEGRCEVYEIRPKICRSFICSKPIEQAKRERDLLHQRREVHSLRYEVFGDRKSLSILERYYTIEKLMKGAK